MSLPHLPAFGRTFSAGWSSLGGIVFVVFGLLCLAPQDGMGALVVVSESFDRIDGTDMDGQAPDLANLPNETFTIQSNRSSSATTYVISSNRMQFGPDHSMGLALGSYFTGDLSVSADVSYGNLAGSYTTGNRGVGLGFNSSADGAWNTFTGLRITPDSRLIFQSNNSFLANVSVSTSSNASYGLSFDLDALTGEISNIVLEGSSADFSSIYTASQGNNYFSGSANLSVFAGGSAAGQYGYLDNLSLSTTAVPEPSTYAAILGALVLGGVVSYRRRKPLTAN